MNKMTAKAFIASGIPAACKALMEAPNLNDWESIKANRQQYTPGDIRLFQTENKLSLLEKYDSPVFLFSKEGQPEEGTPAVMHLHGGAYIYDIDSVHIDLCDRFVSALGVKSYLPRYPLLPEGNYREAYRFLTAVYADLVKKHPVIVLTGDSCGGALALSFAQYLRDEGYRLPDKMILISPFADAELSRPISLRQGEKDIMLPIEVCRKAAQMWADDLPVSDARISPINGDLAGLPETLLFTGSNELFYPDVKRLYRKMKGAGMKAVLVIGKNLFHDYPIFPVEENEKAFQKMCCFLKNGMK